MNILDKRFEYTPAVATDIRKRFDAIRAHQQPAPKPVRVEADAKPWDFVKPITTVPK